MTSLINDIINAIVTVDQKLVDYEKDSKSIEIDITQSGWQEKLKIRSDIFYKENGMIIKELEEFLVLNFKKISHADRKKIWQTLAKTKAIKYNIAKHDENEKDFEKAFLLEIIANLRPDPRDSLLSLNSLVNRCESENIDYKLIITKLIPFSDDEDWSTMGSMRSYLKRSL